MDALCCLFWIDSELYEGSCWFIWLEVNKTLFLCYKISADMLVNAFLDSWSETWDYNLLSIIFTCYSLDSDNLRAVEFGSLIGFGMFNLSLMMLTF